MSSSIMAESYGVMPDYVANRMLLLRLAMGEHATQSFMARAVGCSQPEWAGYESGYRRPSYKRLVKIHQVTGAPPWWVMEGNISGMSADLLKRIDKVRRRSGRNGFSNR